MNKVFLLLVMICCWSCLARAEEKDAKAPVSEAERAAILKQFEGLAGELDHMPQVPEMHHTLQIPEPDSENTSKQGELS